MVETGIILLNVKLNESAKLLLEKNYNGIVLHIQMLPAWMVEIHGVFQSIFQPLLMNIIMFIDSNNYLPITNLLREKNPQIDIAKFLGSILTVKIVIILLYLMNKYENLFLF